MKILIVSCTLFSAFYLSRVELRQQKDARGSRQVHVVKVSGGVVVAAGEPHARTAR